MQFGHEMWEELHSQEMDICSDRQWDEQTERWAEGENYANVHHL